MGRSMEPTCLPMTLAARLAAQADRLGGRCFFHHGGVDQSYAPFPLKDMIISGGYNIYPKEIEDVLYTHPAVLEAAVVGVPHEAKGEVPRAYVVLKEGAAAAPDEILAHLRGQLAAYKLPTSLEVIAALPKTGSGKIRRVELRDRASVKEG